MAKGVIYIMTSVVDGLIKIGKTQTNQFDNRMYTLESNGYKNVTGLKKAFAIEVEEYDEKEALLHRIFDKSRVAGTELFALDVNLAIQLLSALDGKQIYPKTEEKTKEEMFEEATGIIENKVIPNGEYYLSKKIKRYGNKTIKATMKVKDGRIVLLKGSDICPIIGSGFKMGSRRDKAHIRDNMLLKDEVFNSVSMAEAFVIGAAANGWLDWKNDKGEIIDKYRHQ